MAIVSSFAAFFEQTARVRVDVPDLLAEREVWVMDFMSDQLFDGRRIRILTIVDAFSRLSPAIDVRQSYRGSDVVETLERVTRVHDKPRSIRVDNGPEFISKALDLWACMNGVTLDFWRPGKPLQTTLSSNRSMAPSGLNASLLPGS